jgi:HAD superfamily phosphatase
MEDAPGKPDPTGLFATVEQLENEPNNIPTIIYVGDTVADMYTVRKAREINPHRNWIGVGILPPHVQETPAHSDAYSQTLLAAGAAIVLSNVQQLNAMKIAELLEEINKNKQ